VPSTFSDEINSSVSSAARVSRALSSEFAIEDLLFLLSCNDRETAAV